MRCIECEEIELARVSDARPSQTLEIPNAALEGFPGGRSPGELTRRRLLQSGIAGLASIYGPKALGWESVWESAAAEGAALDQNCLVLLYLAGGNDGLNTIVPAGAADYAAYVDARAALHRGQGATAAGRVGSRPLAGPGGQHLAFANGMVSTGGGGDNGDVHGLDTLYGNGTGGAGSDLAVMPAVDALRYSLSHFDNSDIWFKASYDLNVKTGWLGRWIDRNGSATNPLQAVSIDTALSKSIRTAVNPVCAIPSLASLGFSMTGGYGSPGGAPAGVDVNAQMSGLAALAPAPGNAYLARTRATYAVEAER